MSLALKGMAALALFVSLLVFYAIVSRHAFEKRKHVNLLKVLGCPRSLILWTSLGEFFLTMTLATVAGTLGALTLTSVITWRVFDGVFTPNPLQITLTAITFLGVGCLVSYLALSRVLAADPQELLKESS
jgi:predicted lysophospholipase L1 biosynthesis ABC-type transport system permease subunit